MRNIRSRNYPTILTKIEKINKKEVEFSKMNQICCYYLKNNSGIKQNTQVFKKY